MDLSALGSGVSLNEDDGVPKTSPLGISNFLATESGMSDLLASSACSMRRLNHARVPALSLPSFCMYLLMLTSGCRLTSSSSWAAAFAEGIPTIVTDGPLTKYLCVTVS